MTATAISPQPRYVTVVGIGGQQVELQVYNGTGNPDTAQQVNVTTACP